MTREAWPYNPGKHGGFVAQKRDLLKAKEGRLEDKLDEYAR